MDNLGKFKNLLEAFPYFAAIINRAHEVVVSNSVVLSCMKEPSLSHSPGEQATPVPCTPVPGLDCNHAFNECVVEDAFALPGGLERSFLCDRVGKWFSMSLHPIPGNDSEPLLLCLIKDISVEKGTEEQLRETIVQLKTVNHLAKVMQQAHTPEELLQSVIDNVVMVPWLGIKRQVGAFLAEGETLRLAAQRNFSPDILFRCRHLKFGECLCGRVAQSREAYLCTKIGEDHENHSENMKEHGHVILPIMFGETLLGVMNFYLEEKQTLDEEGMKFLRAVCNLTAVSLNRMVLQNSLAQSERLSTIGLVAAGVAHEINNPLTYVQNNIEEIVRLREKAAAVTISDAHDATMDTLPGHIPDEVEELAREAAVGVRRIKTIVTDLKTFSSTKQERRRLISVQKVLESAISMAFSEIKYRARLTRHYSETLLVRGIEGKLAQVFLNLLINAAHAMGEGNLESNRLDLSLYPDGDQVVVEIADTGSGIAPEHLPRIFQAFYTTKAKGEGTGLGLAISAGIIKDMGGTITVKSRQGEGTTFTVRLNAAENQLEVGTGEIRIVQETDPFVRCTVLIVDDDPLIRKTLSRSLSRHHLVVTAKDGAEAITLLETEADINVVVTDLMMENVSGIHLRHWVEKYRPALLPRMIFTTGGAFSTPTSQFLESGEVLWLEKPFHIKALLDMIQRVLTP